MKFIVFLNILFSVISGSSMAAEDPRFNYQLAESDFSKSPYATLDTLRGTNVVWLLTGIAKPSESIYNEDGKLPKVYKGKNAFREYIIWFTPAHNGPPYEIDSYASWKYFEDDKKTYIADSSFYSPSEDWSVDYYTRDNKMIKTDVYQIFFVGKCAYKLTARITSAHNLLVKQELNMGSKGNGCADLQAFSIYKKK